MTLRLLLLALLAGTAVAADPLPKKQLDEVAKKYTDAGFPSPDTVWGGKEYAKAVQAMEKIKKAGKLPLPRRDVLLYRPLFQRFVSEENLAFLADDKRPAGETINEANELLASTLALMVLYFDQSVPDLATSPQLYSTECLEMLLFTMKISNGLLRVLDQVEKTKTDEDRKAPGYISGKKKVREGLNDQLEGCAKILDELGVHSEKDLADFAAQFQKLAPIQFAHLPAEDQAKHLKELKARAKSHPIPTVRKSLADLAQSVESKK